jgi:hypothetical protein
VDERRTGLQESLAIHAGAGSRAARGGQAPLTGAYLFLLFAYKALFQRLVAEVGVGLAAAGINEGVVFRGAARELFHGIGDARVHRDDDIAGKRCELVDGAFEGCGPVGMLAVACEIEAIFRDRIDAVRVHDVGAGSTFAGAPGPAGAARRMARCEMRRHRKVADLQRFAIPEYAHIRDFLQHRWLGGVVLWIVLADGAAFQRGGSGRTGRHLRSAGALQGGEATGVIEVFVGVQDQLDVFHFEAEFTNAGGDQRRRLRQGAIDQDMAALSGNQNGRQFGGADVIGTAVNLERCLGDVPVLALVAVDRIFMRHGRKGCGQQQAGGNKVGAWFHGFRVCG